MSAGAPTWEFEMIELKPWRNPVNGREVVGEPPQQFAEGMELCDMPPLGTANSDVNAAKYFFGALTEDQARLMNWLERRAFERAQQE